MRSRNSAALALTVLLAGCGTDTPAPPRVLLAADPLTPRPVGPAVNRRFVPQPGASYTVHAEHERTAGGATPSAAMHTDRETWAVQAVVANPPTEAELTLSVDATPKRPVRVTYGDGGPRVAPGGGGALTHLLGGPDLAGLCGVRSWLPPGEVRVGQPWPVPHLLRALEDDTHTALGEARIATQARARLEAIDAQDQWVVRISLRREVTGAGAVTIVERTQGQATFDAHGSPVAWSLTHERADLAGGELVQRVRRTVRGRCVRD